MSIGKFAAGFVIGAAAGALIGLLLAPQSGEETREIISDKSKELYGKAQDTVSEIQSKADDAAKALEKKGSELISKLQDVINKQKPEEG